MRRNSSTAYATPTDIWNGSGLHPGLVIEWLILDRDQHPFTKTDLSDLTQLIPILWSTVRQTSGFGCSANFRVNWFSLLSPPFQSEFSVQIIIILIISKPEINPLIPIILIIPKPSKINELMVSKNHPWNIPHVYPPRCFGDHKMTTSGWGRPLLVVLVLLDLVRVPSSRKPWGHDGGFQCKRWVLKRGIYVVYCTLSWDNHDGIYSIYVISIWSIWYLYDLYGIYMIDLYGTYEYIWSI
jgi:hypothetical protein